MKLGQGKSKSPRNAALFLDIVHIVIGIAVVVLAVLAFINPEGNDILFPIIFLLAAVLNGVNGWHKIRESGRDKKKRFGGIATILIAFVLFVISILSAASVWR